MLKQHQTRKKEAQYKLLSKQRSLGFSLKIETDDY